MNGWQNKEKRYRKVIKVTLSNKRSDADKSHEHLENLTLTGHTERKRTKENHE